MSGRWPFKKFKPDPGASSSRKKAKSPPPKKQHGMPYLSINMTNVLCHNNASMGVHDVHPLRLAPQRGEGADPSGASPREGAAR
jgi:hypothetical protein